MKTADVDILIIPGWGINSCDHWQSRWARNLKTARIVVQEDWNRPERTRWTERIVAAARAATRPVLLVGHSCGALAIVHGAALLRPPSGVAGAMLVAPCDLETRHPFEDFMRAEGPGLLFPASFLPLPEQPLPFPSVVIASSDDPYCAVDRAHAFARSWGSEFADAGASGHLNTASGHGPWPKDC